MAESQDFHHSTASNAAGFEDEESLSPLEQEVLDEYARLLGNLNDVRFLTPPIPTILSFLSFLTHCLASNRQTRLLMLYVQMSALLAELSDAPSAAMLDGLRGLERKTSLVFTLLKASVYSIVLNQQIQDNGQENEGERWGQ
jgi:DASH complex subunit DAD3